MALGHPFSILAATDRQGKPKKSAASLQDAHLIRQNDEARRLRRQVDAATKNAAQHGYHACFINPPCSWCLLHLGQCTCVLGVGRGQYACRECHGGWEANQGYIPGKTKNDVRKMRTITTDFTRTPSGLAGSEAETAEADASSLDAKSSSVDGKSPIVDAQMIASGATVYNTQNCRSCHKMNGQGGAGGPDLTHEVQRHADLAWQIEHLESPQKVHPGSEMPPYADLPTDQLKALASYLITRK
jgi:mono/diheme cytochrome c family protein